VLKDGGLHLVVANLEDELVTTVVVFSCEWHTVRCNAFLLLCFVMKVTNRDLPEIGVLRQIPSLKITVVDVILTALRPRNTVDFELCKLDGRVDDTVFVYSLLLK
jgi:hypothetical protein